MWLLNHLAKIRLKPMKSVVFPSAVPTVLTHLLLLCLLACTATDTTYGIYYQCHWFTSLTFCSNAGHVSVLKWLNAKGNISLTDRLGGTPLHDAAEQGQFEVGNMIKIMTVFPFFPVTITIF